MTRAGSAVPVLTPQEIYEQLRDGPGTSTLDGAQAAAHSQAQREADRARMVKALEARIEAGWQGGASHAALGASTPLANNAMDASELLETARDLMGRQSESFHATALRVRPVLAGPPAGDVVNDEFPFATDLDQQVRAYQADAAHNVRVYRDYDNASLFHETNMPTRYPVVDLGRAEVPREDPPPPHDPDPDPDPHPRGGGRSPRGGGSGAPPDVGSPGEQRVPQQTGPDAFVPPVPHGSTPAVPVLPAVQSGPEPGYTHVLGQLGGPLGTTPGTGSGGRGGAPAGSGARAGGGQGAPTAGRPGAPGGATPFGSGPGARAAEEAARRSASGTGPRGGGQGGVPVGPGKGDDDVEHERKVLLRADPEETFGSDAPTAPQVIGDERYEG